MTRRILPCLAALILALAAFCCGMAEDDPDAGWEEGNLLFNPGFEILGEDGLPEGWDISAYRMGNWDTEFSIDRQFCHGGAVSVQLVNYESNDARFVQTVDVEPESMYRLSGWISADQISTESSYVYGANLSVIEGSLTNTNTAPLLETDGDWVYVETYGETGPDQWEVQVCARLGGFSGTAVGTAWFDDLCLEKVEELPAGVIASLWFDPGKSAGEADPGWDDEYDFSYSGEFDPYEPSYSDSGVSGRSTSARAWLFVIAALWVMAAMLLMLLAHYFRTRPEGPSREQTTLRGRSRQALWIWPVLLLGLALRLALAIGILRFDGAGIHLSFTEFLKPDYACSVGYQVDMNCFRLWGRRLFDVNPDNSLGIGVGTANFYAADYFCDYPPLAVLILGLCNLLSGSLGPHLNVTWLQDVVLKLPAMLADLGIAWLIGHEAIRRERGKAYAGILVALVALNPAMILNSACWGQVDSVLAFALAAVAVFAMRRNWIALMPVYMLAVLYKPQALMLGPLGLAVILVELIRNPQCWRRMLIGAALAVGTAFAVILPFTGSQPWTWIFSKYGETLSSYPYVTVNTANLYYLFDLNWTSLKTGAGFWPMMCMAGLCVGWLCWLSVRDPRRGIRRTAVPAIILTLLGVNFALAAVFGEALALPAVTGGMVRANTELLINYGSMHTSALALGLFIAIHLWCRSRRIDTLPLCGALLFMLLYTFGERMHERYVFPALVLLALACAVRHDPRLLVILLLVSFTFFLNEGIVLDNSMTLGYQLGHLNTDTRVLAKILSGMNLAAVLLALWTAYDLCSSPGNDIPVRRRSEVLKGGNTIHE